MAPSQDNKQDISSQETYELLKIRALEDCKVRLLAWEKQRLSIVALVLTVTGLIGGYHLIEYRIDKVIEKRLEKMNSVTDDTKFAGMMAHERAKNAAEQAKKAEEQVQAYGESFKGLQQKIELAGESATELDIKIANQRLEIEGETENVRSLIIKDVNDLRLRLDYLTKAVNALAKESRKVPKETTENIQAIEDEKKKVRVRDHRFSTNAQYQVRIYFNEKTEELSRIAVKEVTKAGFKTSSLSNRMAEKVLSVAQMNAPKGQMRPLPLSGRMNSNTITYTPDADQVEKKAREIRTLIINKLQWEGKHIKLLPAKEVWNPISRPLSVKNSSGRVVTKPLIEVYLVKKIK